jgi:hypothetical protein
MKKLLLVLLLVASPASARAQAGQSVLPCTGGDDTARLAAAIAQIGTNQGTITLPFKSGTRCAVDSLTIPANVTLDNSQGTGIKVNTGQTLTIAGPVINPPTKQLFYNAVAGQGTVAFAAGAVESVNVAWFGATNNASLDDDRQEIQAAIDAAPDGANVYIPRGWNLSIGDTIKLNGRLQVQFSAEGSVVNSGYAGQATKIIWNGAANGKMLEMYNSNSCVVQGLHFQMTGTNTAYTAGYGIFTTADYTITLTGVKATAGSPVVTFTGMQNGHMVNTLPNGEPVHQGRQIVIGPQTYTIANVADGVGAGSLTLTTNAVANSTANATVPTPYGVHSSSSHKFLDLTFIWSTATTNVGYRTGICNDLYSGQNHERIIIRNVTVYGNGGGGEAPDSLTGVSTTAGSPVINFTGSASAVSAAHAGRYYQMPKAGAGGLYLAGRIIAASPTSITLDTNASSTNTGLTGIIVGPLFTTGDYGIGISFGGYYDSGHPSAPSPLKGYGGGANVLECEISDVFLYGLSYGIHGAPGTRIKGVQGSYLNTGLFGAFSGVIEDVRFESYRQLFHGAGDVTFLHAHITTAYVGFPQFEVYGGTSSFIAMNTLRHMGGIYDGTGIPTFKCTLPTICYGTFIQNAKVDNNLSFRNGTEFLGFTDGYVNDPGWGSGQLGIAFTFRNPITFGAGLPALPDGVMLYCSDCAPASNPCTGGGRGTFAFRLSSTWKCF